jgi:hypothetical protein
MSRLTNLCRVVLAACALCVLAAMPDVAYAHEGHGAHAPPTMVKPLVDIEAMHRIAAHEVEAPISGTVAASHAPDDHDCDERGCNAGQTCAASFSLIAPNAADGLDFSPRMPAFFTDAPSRRGLPVPILGPPPKTFA